MRLPDFVIIGAMKCGTSTLHEQLARRSGLFLSTPKEPNFFSDDESYARGREWYASLFESARPDQLCGESSTHYTKLPTYPDTVERMLALIPQARLVYVMRHPIERMASQYVHEWSQNEIKTPFERAVRDHERLIAYSSYATQLEPFLRSYGSDRILPVAFERLLAHPDAELGRICRFIGDGSPEAPRWERDIAPQNVSRQRLRRSLVRDALLALPPVRVFKDHVPERVRERVKSLWRMEQRPELSESLRRDVEAHLDRELGVLGAWLGIELACSSWHETVEAQPIDWAVPHTAPTSSSSRVERC